MEWAQFSISFGLTAGIVLFGLFVVWVYVKEKRDELSTPVVELDEGDIDSDDMRWVIGEFVQEKLKRADKVEVRVRKHSKEIIHPPAVPPARLGV